MIVIGLANIAHQVPDSVKQFGGGGGGGGGGGVVLLHIILSSIFVFVWRGILSPSMG